MENNHDSTLRKQTYQILKETIMAKQPGRNRLPAEEILAKEMNISRSTVREAIQILHREGYITPRKGKGNFAHPSIAQLNHRIDLTGDFMELLQAGAKQVRCHCNYSRIALSSNKLKQWFIQPVQEVFCQHWYYTVDNTPALICKIETPSKLFVVNPQPPEEDFHLIRWLNHYCEKDVAFFAAHLSCHGDPEAASFFQKPTGTPLQNWTEVVHDIYDQEICFVDVYFNTDQIDISMIFRY